MRNKRKAMTLTELLIVLILTGVVAVMAQKVLVYVSGNYKPLYYSAFTNLKHAVGEVMSNDDDATLDNTICTKLATTYNIVDKDVCYLKYNLNPSSTNSIPQGYLDHPTFVLTNGQRFYVGENFVAVGANNYFDIPAIVVMIDLNGSAGPNVFDTKSYSSDVTPDIVSFAVLTNGTVYPMSPMADRSDYITSNVQQCTYDNNPPCPFTMVGQSRVEDNIISSNVSIRAALCSSNTADSDYCSDSTNFEAASSIDARCTGSVNFCRVLVRNPLLDKFGQAGL